MEKDATRSHLALLTTTQKRLQTILERSHSAFWELNLTTQQLYHTWSFWQPHNNCFKSVCEQNRLGEIIAKCHPSDQVSLHKEFQNCLKSAGTPLNEVIRYRLNSNHRWRWIHVRGRATEFDTTGKPLTLAGVYQDISDEYQRLRNLSNMAMRDPLTTLPNRHALKQDFSHYLKENPTPQLGLFYLDLDGFKEVNDTINHGAGDQLLCQLAGLLSQQSRCNEQVYRIGGDEFVMLIRHYRSVAELKLLAKQICQTFNDYPVQIKGHDIQIGISIGIATYRSYDTLDSLLERADTRMYKVKRNGKNSYLYTSLK